METLFFILGIASVVVIASAIVAVVSIVKVTRLQTRTRSEAEGLQSSINDIYRLIDANVKDLARLSNRKSEEADRKINAIENHFTSQLDSRLDRLTNKTDKSIEDLYRTFSDYINNKKK